MKTKGSRPGKQQSFILERMLEGEWHTVVRSKDKGYLAALAKAMEGRTRVRPWKRKRP